MLFQEFILGSYKSVLTYIITLGIELSEMTMSKLRYLQGYRFLVDFGVEGVSDLLVDEPKPVGEGTGPNSVRLLSAAVGQCLSSSLLYCLYKARVMVKSIETTVKTSVMRSEEGRLRVKSIDVQMDPDVGEEDKARVPRCLEIFENYCTVTQSLRKGIEVNVNIA